MFEEPAADAMEPTPSYPAAVATVTAHNDPADGDASTKAKSIGVSIAASVDSEGNRQVYDLDSEGTIRIRKIERLTYRYTSPEIVKTDQKPKASSPLNALAWKGQGLSIVSKTQDPSHRPRHPHCNHTAPSTIP